MNKAVVQINFDLSIPAAEMGKHAVQIADRFNHVDGLIWKIWIANEIQHIAGGIYLFENIVKANEYADGDLVADLRRHQPEVTVTVFEVMQEPSRITKAPLGN